MMNIRSQIKIAAIPAMVLAFFVAVTAVQAGETVVGKVPFEFAIGDQTFPAGEYQFELDHPASGIVLVRNMEHATTATALAVKSGDVVSGTGPAVQFNVYGEKRFLSMIRTSSGTAVSVSHGRQERLLAKVPGTTSLAMAR